MKKDKQKYFEFEKDAIKINSVEELLDEDEEIILRTKPKKSVYIWGSILFTIPFVAIWTALFFLLGLGEAFQYSSSLDELFMILLIGFLPAGLWVWNLITVAFRYKNIHFVLTNKRMIIRKGFVGIDFKTIYYTDVTGVDVKVSWLSRILKVGNIHITAKNQFSILYNISNPYQITQEIQKITNDIKTDMMYPNKLRPNKNPGYNTEYVPETKNNAKKTPTKKSGTKTSEKPSTKSATTKPSTKKTAENKSVAKKK